MTLQEITSKMNDLLEDRDYSTDEVAEFFGVTHVPADMPEDITTLIIKEAARRIMAQNKHKQAKTPDALSGEGEQSE